MARRDYSCNTTFLDMLFNMLLAFVAMFVMAFALAAVKSKSEAPPEANARIEGNFLVELTWDDEGDDDVDLWVSGPGGRMVFFQRKEDGHLFLDRDDVGRRNEVIMTETGEQEVRGNREVVTIRAPIPGEYVVNVFAYALRPTRQINCRVTVTRLRPWSTVTQREISLSANGDEKTVIRFRLDESGAIVGSNDLPKVLSKDARVNGEYSGPSYWEGGEAPAPDAPQEPDPPPPPPGGN
jgi:hypothetical protein